MSLDAPLRYPVLLVNIKSGLSMHKVDKEGAVQVGGSIIGENTLWTIIQQNTLFTSLADSVHAGIDGDHTRFDMTVGDIYGDNMTQLPKDMIASSLGKVKDMPNLVIEEGEA